MKRIGPESENESVGRQEMESIGNACQARERKWRRAAVLGVGDGVGERNVDDRVVEGRIEDSRTKLTP